MARRSRPPGRRSHRRTPRPHFQRCRRPGRIGFPRPHPLLQNRRSTSSRQCHRSEIPAALAQVVGGVVSLHDFYSEPLYHNLPQTFSGFTLGSSYYLAPPDFATIYNLVPLYQQSIDGTGESVAIVGRSNIKLADVRQFRAAFALPANDPQIVVNGPDPGIVSAGEETEADLDVEWSGAVARNAVIKFVVSKSTNSSDGVDLSAQYIVNHNLAPVMSTSFGLCEASLGSSGNSFLKALWQQAAAQGITVFVSSGDNGAAGCDSPSAPSATHGRAVSGLCSTPYSVCVGGTEFNDASNPSLYWSPTNAPLTQASALSYIPEGVWNESARGYGLWSSGGGASSIYAKPSWQTGAGVPADNHRDVPDVSLSSAGHDGYLIYREGNLYVVGGTSAASPSFAGVMALVVQHTAARQGNANTVFYSLAAKQRAGAAAVFHDITTGSNTVPGLTGFNATTAYDQATGLGSIDASLLVSHWSDATAPATPAFQAALSANSLAVNTGSNNHLTIAITTIGTFNSTIAFSITGLPLGMSATFTPASLPAPGIRRVPAQNLRREHRQGRNILRENLRHHPRLPPANSPALRDLHPPALDLICAIRRSLRYHFSSHRPVRYITDKSRSLS